MADPTVDTEISTTSGEYHTERFAQQPEHYNTFDMTAWGGSSVFPLHTFMDPEKGGLQRKDRAELYVFLSFVAREDPDQMTPVEWALLNVARHDKQAQPFADQLIKELGFEDTWEGAYSGDAIARIEAKIYSGFSQKSTGIFGLGGDQWDVKKGDATPTMARFRQGIAFGQQEPIYANNEKAQLAFDIALLYGPGFAVAKGAGIMAKAGLTKFGASRAGTILGNIAHRLATSDTGGAAWVRRAAQGVIGLGVASGTKIGLDQYFDNRDNAQLMENIAQDQQLRKSLLAAGYTIQDSGEAAGGMSDVSLSAYFGGGTSILLDPDGKPVSWDDAEADFQQRQNPDAPVTTTTTVPPPQGAASQTQQTTTTQPAPLAPPVADFTGAGITNADGSINEAAFFAAAEKLGGGENKNPYLGGLTEGYSRGGFGMRDGWMAGAGFDDYDITGKPRYRQLSVEDEISSWSFAQVLDFQEKAIKAKLIDPEAKQGGAVYRPGVLDFHTTDALRDAMTFANNEGGGTTYDEMMDEMILAAERYDELYGENDDDIWTPSRAYFAPDYATMAQKVKGHFGRELGRDPNDWELQLLADEFKGDSRAAYNEEMRGEQSAYEVRGRAQETGEIDYPDEGVDINPDDRMAQNFEEQFKPELNAKDRWAAVQSKSNNLFGSFDKLSRS